MKKLFILIALLISSNLFSQPVTLTSSINPLPGETVNNIDCDTTGIVQGNAGTNQTWNFTNLIRMDSVTLDWVASSSTPYAAQFPASNVASTIDNSNYQYFTTSSTSLLVNGFAGSLIVNSYTDPQTFMVYPFSYDSSFTDNFSSTYTLSGVTVTRTGTTTVTGDATGIINLPFGQFSDALRVKYIVITKDSSFIGIPFVINTTVTSYIWFVPGKKFPVFEIIYTNISGMFPSSSKNVSYSPNSPNIGITNISTGVAENYNLGQNYPNPFNPSTKIKFDIPHSTLVRLTVYDELGRELETLVNQQMQNGSYLVDFNAAGYTSGVYFYKLETKEFSEVKRMILLK